MPGSEDAGHGHELAREDAEALLEVRRELGPSYDAALVDSFAERIERAVSERVDAQIAQRRASQAAVAGAGARQLALGIVSMVAAIPISIVAAAQERAADPAGVLDRHRDGQHGARAAEPPAALN